MRRQIEVESGTPHGIRLSIETDSGLGHPTVYISPSEAFMAGCQLLDASRVDGDTASANDKLLDHLALESMTCGLFIVTGRQRGGRFASYRLQCKDWELTGDEMVPLLRMAARRLQEEGL